MTFREEAAIAAMGALIQAREARTRAFTISPDVIQCVAADAWTFACALDLMRGSGPVVQPGPYSEDPCPR